MSKASNSNTDRRRFLRLAGTTAAAVAVLAPPALAAGPDPDKRFLAMIVRTRAIVDQYVAAQSRAHETYAAAEADPEMPGYSHVFLEAMRQQGSLMSDATIEKMRRYRSDRVRARHGYDVASDAWNAAGDLARPAIERAMAVRPNTVAGALAKWQLAQLVSLRTDIWESEDIEETVFPALVADLARLAGMVQS